MGLAAIIIVVHALAGMWEWDSIFVQWLHLDDLI